MAMLHKEIHRTQYIGWLRALGTGMSLITILIFPSSILITTVLIIYLL
jgi:hypothetical protein